MIKTQITASIICTFKKCGNTLVPAYNFQALVASDCY